MYDEDKRGPGSIREEGIDKARGDVIAFLDDDCVPDKDWLKRMEQKLIEHNADLISGNYEEQDAFLKECRLRRKFPQDDTVNPMGKIGIGGNMLVRKACLLECKRRDGYIYNPLFSKFGSEDVELAWRIMLYGFKAVYVPIFVKHLKRVTTRNYVRQQFKRGIGVSILNKMHKEKKTLRAPQKSLLWGPAWYQSGILKYLIVPIIKLGSLFRGKGFTTFHHVMRYMIGELYFSLGYGFGTLRCRLRSDK
jgi:glycosyltransferase involved in cell wall biosynthesis